MLALLAFLLIPCALAEQISGKIINDVSGAAVISADVKLYKVGQRFLAADLETDREGRFQASELAPGEYRLEILKPAYATISMPIRIDASKSFGTTLRLTPCGSISGSVQSIDGKPVIGAHVLAMTRSTTGLLRPMPRARGYTDTTDSQGHYRLFNLLPGEYAIAVSYGASPSQVGGMGRVPSSDTIGSGFLLHPSNTRPQMISINGGEEQSANFVIMTSTLHTVSGKVESDNPKVSFWAALTLATQPSVAAAVSPVADDGSFKLEGIPPGSYYLSASGPVIGRGLFGASLAPKPLFARTRIDVVAQDIGGIVLTPQPGSSVKVRLLPVEGSQKDCPATAPVSLTNLEDSAANLQRSIEASRDKDTLITDLPPGRYQLTALSLGAECYQTTSVTIDVPIGPQPVAIPLGPPGSVRGTVTGPEKDGLVVLLLVEEVVRSAEVDANGEFSLTAVPPGRHRILVRPRLGARWFTDVSQIKEIDIRSGAATQVELSATPIR